MENRQTNQKKIIQMSRKLHADYMFHTFITNLLYSLKNECNFFPLKQLSFLSPKMESEGTDISDSFKNIVVLVAAEKSSMEFFQTVISFVFDKF